MKHICIPVDPESVVPALYGIRPGQQIIYHTGVLAIDRDYFRAALSEKEVDNIRYIANLAMDLCSWGKLYLIQRKYSEFSYQYIAIGKKRKTHDATNSSKEPEVASSIN